MPMYEQAKVEEQKSIPTIMVIDKAVAPQLKDSPKRSVIILGVLFLFLSFFLSHLFLLVKKQLLGKNLIIPFKKRMSNFFKRLIKIYQN